MKLGYATFVLPIAARMECQLKSYLVNCAEPQWLNPATGRLVCQTDFAFDQIGTLHFCSFHILPQAMCCAGSLVFEATFDGSRSDFIDELLRVMPKGLDTVLQLCSGYPKSAMSVPALVKAYLEEHDAGANTFFSGSPGRTVPEVEGEHRLRGALAGFLRQRPAAAGMPQTLVGVQKELQTKAVRHVEQNRWAEEAATVPWEVRWGMLLLCAVVIPALIVAAGLGVLALKGLGWDLQDISSIPGVVLGWADSLGHRLTNSNWWLLAWFGNAVAYLRMPWLYALIGFAVLWLVLRLGIFILDDFTDNPRHENFIVRFLLSLLKMAHKALLFALVGYTLLAIAGHNDLPATHTASAPAAVGTAPFKAIVQRLDRTVAIHDRGSGAPSIVASIILLFGAAATYAVLKYWQTSLKLAVQFVKPKGKADNARQLLLDVVALGVGIVAIFAIYVVARHLPPDVKNWLIDWLVRLVQKMLIFATYAAAGVLATYLLVALPIALLIRYLELSDRSRHSGFKQARDLLALPFNEKVIAREEGGTNRYQNYLGSMTYVKPGIIRKYLLRATLWLIHLLARFMYNRGELGQISTILAARWVLVDGGRRLLFLDNYSGGWESYLNEFIDMAAVRGLNAIWTNTFVLAGDDNARYAFPKTDFYIWRGAQDEKPFKAYVRQSQIETLVWYGAYPTLSIKNITTNAFLRKSLFEPLTSHEVDRIVQRL